MDTPTSITFNSYDLQDATFKTRIIQHTSLPDKLVQMEPQGRRDCWVIVDAHYLNRPIEVEGVITADTRADLVEKVDEMKKKLRETSGDLDIDFGGTTRRYFATVQRLEMPEDFFNVTLIKYKIVFLCADPFGYATTSGTVSLSSQTDLLTDIVLTVSGSYKVDPVITLTINTAVNVSTIEASNEDTGESIVISTPSGAFSNSDVLIINSRTKEVFLNASGVDYTGRFPTIQPDTTRLRISVQGDNINYDTVVQYSPNYL